MCERENSGRVEGGGPGCVRDVRVSECVSETCPLPLRACAADYSWVGRGWPCPAVLCPGPGTQGPLPCGPSGGTGGTAAPSAPGSPVGLWEQNLRWLSLITAPTLLKLSPPPPPPLTGTSVASGSVLGSQRPPRFSPWAPKHPQPQPEATFPAVLLGHRGGVGKGRGQDHKQSPQLTNSPWHPAHCRPHKLHHARPDPQHLTLPLRVLHREASSTLNSLILFSILEFTRATQRPLIISRRRELNCKPPRPGPLDGAAAAARKGKGEASTAPPAQSGNGPHSFSLGP